MFNIEARIGAKFQLLVHKGDGLPVRSTGVFDNIVLDIGLARLGSLGDTFGSNCYVGSGNSTPVATQTTLDNIVASTASTTSTVNASNTTTAPFYVGVRRTFRFGAGAAAGNLTEVGIGWGATTLFNRALIKDALGNPTTLTILTDEFLDVTVEVRIYPSTTISGSFNFTDKLGAIIDTINYTGNVWIGAGLAFTSYQGGSIGVYKNADISGSPSVYMGGSRVAYKTPTHTKSAIDTNLASVTFGLDEANDTINGVFFELSVLQNYASNSSLGYKILLDKPLTKHNLQEWTWKLNYTWARV